MSSFDDLFRQEASDRSIANDSEQPFDKEAWAQKKQELRQWTYDTIDAATTAIAQNGEQFQQYLDVQSRFDRYSVSNALLILAQRPEATRIADFDTWKEQGVYIRRKETGFYILEPGEEYEREDGSKGISYNPKKIFDIAQTTANQKREQAQPPDDRTRIKALMDRSPVPIAMSDTRSRQTYRRSISRIRAALSSAAAWMPAIFSVRSLRSWLMPNWNAAITVTAVPLTPSMRTVRRTCCASSLASKRRPSVFNVCRKG